MRLSILISFFFFPILAVASDSFVIYRAKHRPAEELITVARGVFGQDAALSALNEKIVINGNRMNAKAVLQLFEELDRPPRMYLVTSRIVSKSSAESNQTEAQARVKVGRENSAGIRARVSQQNAESAGATESSLRLLEGREGVMLQGSLWFPSGLIFRITGGQGNSHRLEIRQMRSSPYFLTQTELQLPLGKWQDVSRVEESKSSKRKGILQKDAVQKAQESVLQVRLELAQ